MRIPLLEMDSVSAKLNMMPATVTSSALALFWLPLPLVPGPSSFRNRKRITLILNRIEPGILFEMGRSRIGGQPPGESDVHGPGTVRETLASYGSVPESGPPFPLTNGSSNQLVLPFYFSVSGFFFHSLIDLIQGSFSLLPSPSASGRS
ncbi:hypothetical protein L1887_48497 [Cichorium endivia]|nr:hypothetical protein L1887_48497 [Cichorium endivia]